MKFAEVILKVLAAYIAHVLVIIFGIHTVILWIMHNVVETMVADGFCFPLKLVDCVFMIPTEFKLIRALFAAVVSDPEWAAKFLYCLLGIAWVVMLIINLVFTVGMALDDCEDMISCFKTSAHITLNFLIFVAVVPLVFFLILTVGCLIFNPGAILRGLKEVLGAIFSIILIIVFLGSMIGDDTIDIFIFWK